MEGNIRECKKTYVAFRHLKVKHFNNIVVVDSWACNVYNLKYNMHNICSTYLYFAHVN